MNFIRNYFQKRTNIYLENQDYEFAKELHKGMEELIKKGNIKYGQLQHLEGIFLDITDRTQAHPRVPFATEDGKPKKISKGRVISEPPPAIVFITPTIKPTNIKTGYSQGIKFKKSTFQIYS